MSAKRAGAAGLQRLQGLPLAEQATISRTLGASQPAFRAARTTDGWRLNGGGVAANLGAGSVRLLARGGAASLSLVGIGRASTESLPGTARTAAAGNRVSYSYTGIRAWYAAGPLGLEQGFMVTRRPGGARGPVTIGLRLRSSLAARPMAGGHGVALIDSRGRSVLRYDGLSATDARGRSLGSRLELSGGRVLIRVLDAGAAYPLRIDPMIQVGELVAADTGEGLGSVAVSGDTVFAAAPNAAVGAASGGAVFVLTQPPSGWGGTVHETAVLTAPGSVSGLGDLGVFAASQTVFAATGNTVYAFSEPAGGWSGTVHPVASLTPSDGAKLGSLVMVSDSEIVAGKQPFSSGPGAVYVFVRPAGGWSGALHESATLTASDGMANDDLGVSVAAEGNTVVAGAPDAQVGSERLGAVYVFQEPATGWSGAVHETAKLTGSDLHPTTNPPSSPELGWKVAVSGPTIVASQGGGFGPGVYVFNEPAGGWQSGTQSAKLVTPDGHLSPAILTSWSGAEISGQTIAVPGFLGTGPATSGTPVVFMYTEPPGGWSGTLNESATLEASDGGLTGDASTVMMSGQTVFAGGVGDVAGQTVVGNAPVYVFSQPSSGWAGIQHETAKLSVANGGPASGDEYLFSEPSGGWQNDTQSATLAPSGSTSFPRLGAVAVDGRTAVVADLSSKLVDVFTEPAGGWSSEGQVAQLIDPGTSASDGFASTLAISGGTVVVGAPSATVGSTAGEGAAYVFSEPPGGWTGTVPASAELTPSDGAKSSGFGSSVAVSGSTVAATAHALAPPDNHLVGEGYLFSEPTGGWNGSAARIGRARPHVPGTAPAEHVHCNIRPDCGRDRGVHKQRILSLV